MDKENDGRPDGAKSAPNVGAPPRSITILQGAFTPKFFDQLKKRTPQEVFVMEGRPTLEAGQANCRQLLKRKITPTLICDNMAGFLFFKDLVKEIWIAYQLSAEDGALCETGALILGVLGKRHKIPVHLFPSDRKTKFLGKEKDLMRFQNKTIAPKGIRAYVPLVDWLPGKYVTKVHNE